MPARQPVAQVSLQQSFPAPHCTPPQAPSAPILWGALALAPLLKEQLLTTEMPGSTHLCALSGAEWRRVHCRGTCALKHVQRPETPTSFPPLSNPLPWTSGAITSGSSRTVPNRPPPVPSRRPSLPQGWSFTLFIPPLMTCRMGEVFEAPAPSPALSVVHSSSQSTDPNPGHCSQLPGGLWAP